MDLRARTLPRRGIVLDPVEYAALRPMLRARLIPLRAERRVQLGDRVGLAFENAETLHYQVQEMLMVEGVTDEALVAEELAGYGRLLPTSHALVATLFVEHDDVRTVKQELQRLRGLQHSVRLEIGADPATGSPPTWVVPGVEIPGPDESGPSVELQAVHFLRFDLSDAARDAVRDPAVRMDLSLDHPLYAAVTTVNEVTRTRLIADLALDSPDA